MRFCSGYAAGAGASSPRLARIWFCAGTGSSSTRGIRGGRITARSGAGGMKGALATMGASWTGGS